MNYPIGESTSGFTEREFKGYSVGVPVDIKLNSGKVINYTTGLREITATDEKEYKEMWKGYQRDINIKEGYGKDFLGSLIGDKIGLVKTTALYDMDSGKIYLKSIKIDGEVIEGRYSKQVYTIDNEETNLDTSVVRVHFENLSDYEKHEFRKYLTNNGDNVNFKKEGFMLNTSKNSSVFDFDIKIKNLGFSGGCFETSVKIPYLMDTVGVNDVWGVDINDNIYVENMAEFYTVILMDKEYNRDYANLRWFDGGVPYLISNNNSKSFGVNLGINYCKDSEVVGIIENLGLHTDGMITKWVNKLKENIKLAMVNYEFTLSSDDGNLKTVRNLYQGVTPPVIYRAYNYLNIGGLKVALYKNTKAMYNEDAYYGVKNKEWAIKDLDIKDLDIKDLGTLTYSRWVHLSDYVGKEKSEIEDSILEDLKPELLISWVRINKLLTTITKVLGKEPVNDVENKVRKLGLKI